MISPKSSGQGTEGKPNMEEGEATSVQHYINHVDNTIFPKDLLHSAATREVAILKGVIGGITKLDYSNPDQAIVIDDIFAKARQAVMDALQERKESCPGYAMWSEHQEGYRERLLEWLGKSVGQFATTYRMRMNDEVTARYQG